MRTNIDPLATGRFVLDPVLIIAFFGILTQGLDDRPVASGSARSRVPAQLGQLLAAAYPLTASLPALTGRPAWRQPGIPSSNTSAW